MGCYLYTEKAHYEHQCGLCAHREEALDEETSPCFSCLNAREIGVKGQCNWVKVEAKDEA